MLKEYTEAYFSMIVEILPTIDRRRINLTIRLNPYSQNRQLLTGDILHNLKSILPADAFCVLAITMEDLYPDPTWNFVFGQASLHDRVGVFSFARYDPIFYGESRGSRYRELLFNGKIIFQKRKKKDLDIVLNINNIVDNRKYNSQDLSNANT